MAVSWLWNLSYWLWEDCVHVASVFKLGSHRTAGLPRGLTSSSSCTSVGQVQPADWQFEGVNSGEKSDQTEYRQPGPRISKKTSVSVGKHEEQRCVCSLIDAVHSARVLLDLFPSVWGSPDKQSEAGNVGLNRGRTTEREKGRKTFSSQIIKCDVGSDQSGVQPSKGPPRVGKWRVKPQTLWLNNCILAHSLDSLRWTPINPRRCCALRGN